MKSTLPRRTVYAVVAAATILLLSSSGRPTDLTQYVNPLQGSNSIFEFSTGNTYPAVAVPWGMNFWTPQTRKMGNGWQYTYTDSTICGFKQTHQPSPWINDYGCFSIMPITGNPVVAESKRASYFSHEQETALPHYYSVELEKYGIKTEITPSTRGAMFRLNYPSDEKQKGLVIDCFNGDGYIKILPKERRIEGYSRFYSKANKAELPDNFATYFVIEFDTPFEVASTWISGEDISLSELEREGKHVGGYVSFHNSNHVELKIASSFISIDQASQNLEQELRSKSFNICMMEARDQWNEKLGRTHIKGGTQEQLRTFYTALYRTMLFPYGIHEITQQGDTVHYSPFMGSVREGVMYTGNGFWDTFRAIHPYFTIMYPELSRDIMRSMVNYYLEGGWIPEWFSPGFNDCMIGQNSVSVIADAYIKGIRDFDVEKLWEGMEKGASKAGPNATGRDGIEYYASMGYIPYDTGHSESVSKTLEYSYNDYCMWLMGREMGLSKDRISVYLDRAFNYRNVFDAKIGFVRPKDSKGRWMENFRPDTWGGGFTEGSSWHWTWSVFHDPKGLIELMGGEENFVSRMDSVFKAPPTFDAGNYKKVIHEMTEMIACNMGQYAHGNQPIQHMIYLYNYAGKPYKAQYHLRQVMDKLYSSGWADGKGLCGDEDNGQTSAWYVFSAMGFYPVCPGSNEYIIGSPLFEEISLDLPNGKKFTVRANNNNSKNVYIQSATLNGVIFDKSYIKHDQLICGGVLEFEMGAQPCMKWASSAQSRPSSLSEIYKPCK